MKEQEYTLTIFTENKPGIFHRVIGIITRRHINIESVTASTSSIDGIHKIVILIKVDQEQVRKLIAQIDKQVDVLKAFYYDNEDIVYQEIALYKIPTSQFYNGNGVENLIREHNARILRIEEEYIVIEKTGHESETEALLEEFKSKGIFEFIRSGRVAIVKPMEQLNKYLKSIEK